MRWWRRRWAGKSISRILRGLSVDFDARERHAKANVLRRPSLRQWPQRLGKDELGVRQTYESRGSGDVEEL